MITTQLPIVSVLMPVYNAQRYLAEAMESILNQTFSDFEFLIVDDGSNDRSLTILRRYAQQDARIQVASRSNQGFVATLNELVPQAKGEFIARMDADDIALPERFARQVAFLRDHRDVVCVAGAYDLVDESGWILAHCQEAETDAEIQAQLLSGRICINHPSAMMRRSALLQVGGYDDTAFPAEDLDLWLRLGEVGKLANLPDTVLRYRQHPQSVSERKQREQQQMKQIVCERAWTRRRITWEFTETKPWRPIDALSRYHYLLKCGRQLFATGQRYPAVVYGIKAIRAFPLKMGGWKLFIGSLVKQLPRSSYG